MDLGARLLAPHDVKLIEANHATQDGRMKKNLRCRHLVGRHFSPFQGRINTLHERQAAQTFRPRHGWQLRRLGAFSPRF